MSESDQANRRTEPARKTTDQAGELACDLDFGSLSFSTKKYLLTEVSHQQTKLPAFSGERRYLRSLWVFCSREDDEHEPELSPSTSIASYSELVAPISASLAIKEKIRTALTGLAFRERRVLIQFWAPMTIEGRCALTTSGQPFGLGVIDEQLCLYRMESLRYKFVVDGNNREDLGLPGRVFLHNLPEWTPDVECCSDKDYPLRDHALRCNIHGSLALPVSELSGQRCVGVLELVMSSKYLDYAYEVQEVCCALENVDLKSPKLYDNPSLVVSTEGYQHTMDEIFKALNMVCVTHKLPLAQTWVESEYSSIVAYNNILKKSCSSFDISCLDQICMSTTNLPFYVADVHMWQFRKACTEHHLQKGKGVVGRSSTNKSFFCTDITELKETEYPLVHFARKYGLTSCFAICLWSIHQGNENYIIEFFLPHSITILRDIQKLVAAALVTFQLHFQSFEASKMVLDFINLSSNSKPEPIPILQCTGSLAGPRALVVEDDAVNNENNGVSVFTCSEERSESIITCAEKKSGNAVNCSERNDTKRKSERKHGKAEKSISFEDIEKQFNRTIEDAALSLCVSRSTLKRLCRRYGISRWPSHKHDNDNVFPLKLKRTKEPIQETGGGFASTSRSLNKPSDSVHSTPLPANFIWSNPQNSGLSLQRVGTPLPISDDLKGRPRYTKAPRFAPISDDLVFAKPLSLLEGRPNENMLNSNSLTNVSSLTVGRQTPETNSQFSDLPSKQALFNVTDEISAVTTIPSLKTLSIKAKYKDDIVKFMFPLSEGKVELEKQVLMRFQLDPGSFNLKYQDEDGDLILIGCDEDVYSLMSLDSNIVRLTIQPKKQLISIN